MRKQKKSFKKSKNKVKNGFNVKKKLLLILLGGVIGFLNGFFGGGGGMICVPTLEKSLNLNNKQAHATAIAVIFPLSLISCFIYVFNGAVDSLPLLTVGLGVLLGGIIGSLCLKFMSSKILRILFSLIMLVGGIRLIL